MFVHLMFGCLMVSASMIFEVCAMTESERSIILNAHNNYRRILATGKVANKDGSMMPQGADIYELTYDKSIEEMAQKHADRCVIEHSTFQGRNYTGENINWSVEKDPAKALQSVIDWWWSELKTYGMETDLMWRERSEVGHWAQIAWAKTTKIGCGWKVCPSKDYPNGIYYVVCNYYQYGNIYNLPVYTAGSPCSKCAKCNDNLCVGPLPTLMPAVDASHRTLVLDIHNNYRRTLSSGKARNKTGELLPQGANINLLTYDSNTLESTAQQGANSCSLKSRTYEERKGAGELMYYNYGFFYPDEALKMASDAWWAQLETYGVNSTLEVNQADFNRGIYSWSQMVWAKTTKLGCGVQHCPKNSEVPTDFTLVICDYSPAVNYGQVYEAGTSCSKCSKCSDKLCVS
uniref:Venom allergen-like protein n=1 Tax=Ditylenchus destructor TaxID=166010 RepID=T1PT55_9BILA|nr:venom allergen-like protein [Ditylenchus destructor]